MATLAGKDINQSYQGLVKAIDNNAFTGKVDLTDGTGGALSLQLGRKDLNNGASVTGSLDTTGSVTVGTNLIVNNTSTHTGDINAVSDIHVSNDLTIAGNLTANSPTFLGDMVFRGPTTLYNTLSVVGSTTLSGSLSVGGGFDASITGNLSCDGDIIAFASSDKRLKENIQPLDSKIYFDELKAYTFDWKEEAPLDGEGKGFIAQEVEKVDPTLIKLSPTNHLQVNYISFIPILFNEIQSLKKEVEELKNGNIIQENTPNNEIELLKEEISNLSTELKALKLCCYPVYQPTKKRVNSKKKS